MKFTIKFYILDARLETALNNALVTKQLENPYTSSPWNYCHIKRKE